MKNLLFKCSAVFTIFILMGCSVAPVSTGASAVQQQDNEAESFKPAGSDISINKPVVIPPGFNDRPALSPSKGLKIDSLFDEELKDINMRFKRLEEAHIDFRKEYEKIKPAIVRLVSIENDLQVLMLELNGFVDEQSSTKPASPSLQSQKPISELGDVAPLQDVTVAPIATMSPIVEEMPKITEENVLLPSVTLKDIRIGNHPNKVRVVFETSIQSEYSIDLNNNKKIMTVSFVDTSRNDDLDEESVFVSNPLLSSYKIKQQGSVVQVIINLKRATKVQFEEVLVAKTEQKNDRLVIDLAL